MKDIVSCLVNFGFSKTEAAVYVALLKIGKANGYKITKEINVAKSTVYQALDFLYRNGYIFLVPGTTKEYEAKDPKLLFCDLQKKFSENMNGLKNAMSTLRIKKERDFFYKVEGIENIRRTLLEIIGKSQKEIYINSDFRLDDYKNELKKAIERGVRIILFSFNKVDDMGLDIEVYHKSSAVENYQNPTRFMIVSDLKDSMIVTRKNENVAGIYTDDEIFIKTVSEHIHGDIYMAKISNIFEESFADKIKIDTLHEHKNLIK